MKDLCNPGCNKQTVVLTFSYPSKYTNLLDKDNDYKIVLDSLVSFCHYIKKCNYGSCFSDIKYKIEEHKRTSSPLQKKGEGLYITQII